MEIDQFIFITFDEKDQNHLLFERRIIRENEPQRYVLDIHERLRIPQRDIVNTVSFQQAYLVYEKERKDFVGYLYLSCLQDTGVTLEFFITKLYRRQGLGSQLLDRITYYLFSHYPNIAKIRLSIHQSNYAGMHTVEKAGYYYNEEIGIVSSRLLFDRVNPYSILK